LWTFGKGQSDNREELLLAEKGKLSQKMVVWAYGDGHELVEVGKREEATEPACYLTPLKYSQSN